MMIRLERKDHVGYIVLDRPDRHNALSAEGYRKLRDCLYGVSTDPEVKVVILEGEGKSFCAGSDVSELVGRDLAELRSHFHTVAQVFKGISECKKLVIAAVHGYALGGGCALAAAADFAIASEDAQFGLPEVDLNLFPMTIMPVIVRAVGMRKGLELLCTGERVGAEEALRIGLVNRVVARSALYSAAESLANKLCSISQFALEMGKEAYQISQSMEYFTSIDYLHNIMAMVASHKEAQEGIVSFLERGKGRKESRV